MNATITSRSTATEIKAALAAQGIAAPAKARKQELLDLLHPELAIDLGTPAEDAPAPVFHDVVTMNMRDGSVQGHAAGCADLKRGLKKFAEPDQANYPLPVTTKHEAWLDYNQDFIAEGSGTYDIEWLPCAAHVPAGEADTTPEAPLDAPESADEAAAADFTAEPADEAEKAADAVKGWQGNYNTVFAPAAELLAPKSVKVWTVNVSTMLKETHIAGADAKATVEALAEIEKAANAALRTWQKTQDRKGQTDMEKFNQNRSFLAGYLAAAAPGKKLPTIAFAKDMEKAIRPDAHAAGVAARKASK